MVNIDLPKRDNSPKSLFNPLNDDFTTEIRDDNNKIRTYTIPSMEIATFPAYLAERIEKDLIIRIKDVREVDLFSKEKEDEIRKEIEINEPR